MNPKVHARICAEIQERHARDIAALRGEVERLRVCLSAVNDIRNSIIGAQTFNWSEHAYPLVAALNAAGIEGAEYPAARANVGTLLDRANKAEGENARLAAEVERLKADAERLDFIASRCRADPRMDGNHVYWPTSFNHRLTGPNLRAAIDAARGGES